MGIVTTKELSARDSGSDFGDNIAVLTPTTEPPAGGSTRFFGPARRLFRAAGTEKVRIPVLFLTGAPALPLDERGLASGEPVELALEIVEVAELSHPVGPHAQLVQGLRTAEHHHREEGELALADIERIVECVRVAQNRTPVRRVYESHESLGLGARDRRLNSRLSKVHHRFAARLLITGEHQGVERERVLVRSRQLLLDE